MIDWGQSEPVLRLARPEGHGSRGPAARQRFSDSRNNSPCSACAGITRERADGTREAVGIRRAPDAPRSAAGMPRRCLRGIPRDGLGALEPASPHYSARCRSGDLRPGATAGSRGPGNYCRRRRLRCTARPSPASRSLAARFRVGLGAGVVRGGGRGGLVDDTVKIGRGRDPGKERVNNKCTTYYLHRRRRRRPPRVFFFFLPEDAHHHQWHRRRPRRRCACGGGGGAPPSGRHLPQ